MMRPSGQTGHDTAPKSRQEPHWQEWKTFHRREFEKYLNRYVDAIHSHSPKFQIACNWMYSLLSGVWPVGSRVDYLSGDYSQHGSTDEARAEARYFASNRKPWDLLGWGFNKHGLKSATQLKQEAGATIMQGGAWGVYYVPTRFGRIPPEVTTVAAEVADLCRARQAVSFRSETVPQVALLQSAETYWDQADSSAFGRPECREDTKVALFALLELHYSMDLLSEHQLLPRLREFPVVVIPDAYKLSDDFRRALVQYVEAGGSLVLLGDRCARLFEADLGVKLGSSSPTVSRTKGKGRIVAALGTVVSKLAHPRPAAVQKVLSSVMREAFPQPAVETDAPSHVDLALRRTRDGRLSVHLLNLTKVQRGETEFPPLDPYPTVGPIAVRLRIPNKPAVVRWEPDRQKIEWSWRDGVLTAAVPTLQIHGVLVVE
jgi:hypothetical protein